MLISLTNWRRSTGRRFLFWFFAIFCWVASFAQTSTVEKYDDAGGSGLYPFNFRVIDKTFMAGGYLFNPQKKQNSPEKVREYLRLLKKMGARSLILLHVPLKDLMTDQLEQLCHEEKIDLLKVRMNSQQIPDAAQTVRILELIDAGAYVHCMWGCDRTGAIIGRYLREKHAFSGRQAFEAVVGGGTHAGPLGGFKKVPANLNLLLYFWPEVSSEAPDIFALYRAAKR
ncbi:MAG: hypothetical protein PHV05_01560 [Candidatus Riflebacteria bacterium]|nr:hypothetical protein [Candidatus Riflebacteria bacterium]